VKLPSCYYKRYIANNNLSDIDTKLLDTNSSDSDNKEEEETVEVAANSQDFSKVVLF
jgi:hypothetical protein